MNATVLKFKPTTAKHQKLGARLVQAGFVDAEALDTAIAQQQSEDARLGELLVAKGALDPDDLLDTLAEQMDTQAIDLAVLPSDPRLMEGVEPADCLSLGWLPWRMQGGVFVVAISAPENIDIIKMRLAADYASVRFVLVDDAQLQSAVHKIAGARLARSAEARVPPTQSCRKWSVRKLCVSSLVLAGVFLCLYLAHPASLLWVFVSLAIVTLIANTALKACCLILAIAAKIGQKSATLIPATMRQTTPLKLPKVSILVPLYHEENIASALIKRLERLTYPVALLDICLVVEADDAITRRAMNYTQLPSWMRVIRVPPGGVKTKPRAMNYALDFTKGDIIGIYDAEDAPDPDQLYRVARKFQDSDANLACVQGILSFYNARTNWLSRCFSFEYAGWFRVMLPGLQRLGFAIPLGGTTLFFRREVLIELGAWDAHNVTEDADLGMRLARYGYRCEILDTVTQEEANSHIWPWVRQRSRWLKGYAMTWAVHMRDPAKLYRELGAWKFFGFQLLFLGTLISFFLAPLLWWAAASAVLGVPGPITGGAPSPIFTTLAGFFIAAELTTLSLFIFAGAQLDLRPSFIWVLTLPLYFTFATIAAYKGLLELFIRPFYWDKTDHGQFGGQDWKDGASDDADLARINLEPCLEGHGKMIAQRS